MKAPCYNCTNRILNCHSTCESYKSYQGTRDVINENRKIATAKRDDLIKSVFERRKKFGSSGYSLTSRFKHT